MSKRSYNVWLMGGLGNQLFQINYGYRLRGLGHEVHFVDTLTKHSLLTKKILSWTIHPYVLDKIIPVECRTLNAFPVLFAKGNILNQWSNYMGCELSGTLPRHIFGYFQCRELHDSVYFEKDISSLLWLDSSDRTDIAAHLRFGDAPNLEQNIKYYISALKKVSDCEVCICTDDKDFAKPFLDENSFNNYYFSEGDLIDDFRVLANASVVIAAPSTFSFWAIKLSAHVKEFYIPKELYAELGAPSKSPKVHVI